MKSYGQFCPLAQASQILCERWTMLIVRELIAGSTRFNELHRSVPRMSPTLLSLRLKQLQSAGIITIEGARNNLRYQLSPSGLELRPIVELFGVWGHRWATTQLSNEDLDAGLLMWDMRRSIQPDVFPTQRIVVEFYYPDAAEGHRRWWLMAAPDDTDLCLEDPGFEVDIYLEASLKAMTDVWTCKLTLNQAIAARTVTINGDPALTSKLERWLQCSALSRLGEQQSR